MEQRPQGRNQLGRMSKGRPASVPSHTGFCVRGGERTTPSAPPPASKPPLGAGALGSWAGGAAPWRPNCCISPRCDSQGTGSCCKLTPGSPGVGVPAGEGVPGAQRGNGAAGSSSLPPLRPVTPSPLAHPCPHFHQSLPRCMSQHPSSEQTGLQKESSGAATDAEPGPPGRSGASWKQPYWKQNRAVGLGLLGVHSAGEGEGRTGPQL